MKNSAGPEKWSRLTAWLEGDLNNEGRLSVFQTLEEREPAAEPKVRGKKKAPHSGKHSLLLYHALAIMIALAMACILLYAVVKLPDFGDPDSPMLNTVSDRYLEQGLEETGAVNATAGMILDYRAFDTFGESTVLFTATMAVVYLLRGKQTGQTRAGGSASVFEVASCSDVLRGIARLIIPFIFLFGIYVVLNGHISPGGGFSGGAILGAGLILTSVVVGQNRLEAVLTPTVNTRISVACLLAYAAMKSYSFFTGANHVGWEIPKGTPGAILSAGFILPLDICVGMIVACTMYRFYALFSKGGG